MIPLSKSLMRKNVLYIHGLGSDKNSSTFNILKQNFKEYNWYTDTFNLMDPNQTIRQINNIIKTKNISILIGSSFGAFYVLSITNSLAKIVINPCMMPHIEIPKLTDEELDISLFKKMEDNVYNDIDGEMRICTFGVFGDNDNLFSYKDKFKKLYGGDLIVVNGQHKLERNSLVRGVAAGLSYFKELNTKLNESLICEHFVNIFTKSDNTNKLSKYKNEVYDILQKSYAPIGGLLGCRDIDDLINDTDFWKLCIKNNKVVAALVYTFKRGGRKLVYGGTDGTPMGKEWFYKIIQEDINFSDRQAWAEVSGAMEHIYLKRGAIPIPANISQEIMKDKPFTKIHDDNLHYDRIIGGENHTKILVGFPKINK